MTQVSNILEDGRIIPDRIYSRTQVAHILSRNPRTLYRWEQEGIGPRITRQTPTAAPEYRGSDLIAHIEQSAK